MFIVYFVIIIIVDNYFNFFNLNMIIIHIYVYVWRFWIALYREEIQMVSAFLISFARMYTQ